MTLPDISTAQSTFLEHVYTLRSQAFLCAEFVVGNEKRLGSFWNSFCVPPNAKSYSLGHIKMCCAGLTIKAIAALKPLRSAPVNKELKIYHNVDISSNSSSASMSEHQSSSEDLKELDQSEKLRRMRISKANKGNTPWNKGRKHSPETLQRIRERTKLAMQDPKVKMKLANLGHAQSEETKAKIGVGVRMGWERRRKKLMVQETCHFEWQELIAQASRKGYAGEEELQWDSYEILDKVLEQEWVESVEQRKRMLLRPKGSKRAPKSLEQRRKISEAITAKWADPEYHERFYAGLAKYYGKPAGVERKPKRRPTGDGQPRKRNTTKKNAAKTGDSASARTETKVRNLQSGLKKSNVPQYKDPLANSKLEMIKNIRAQRAAAENKKFEAITRAKLLIAEAESAAKCLEAAATRSPIAQAALIEARKLIAEAIQSIESIEMGQADACENGGCIPSTPNEPANHFEKEMHAETEDLNQPCTRKVNGSGNSVSNRSVINDLYFSKFSLQEDLLNGKDEVLSLRADGYVLLNGEERLQATGSGDYGIFAMELDRKRKHSSFTNQVAGLESNGSDRQERRYFTFGEGREQPKSRTATKKWIRGRLVEVAEGDEL